MAKDPPRVVLFLGMDDHARSRVAAILFNQLARRMSLNWFAVSRGLAVGEKHVKGPISAAMLKDLHTRGERSSETTRAPMSVSEVEWQAAKIIAVDRDVMGPLLTARSNEIEYWQLAADDFDGVEREVYQLVTRLLGGRLDAPVKPVAVKPAVPKKVLTAKVGRETAGRKGKGVTTIFDLPITEAELQALAQTLKNRCGTGGTVKDRRIEIQGDNRERIVAELEKLGYQVKRVGG